MASIIDEDSGEGVELVPNQNPSHTIVVRTPQVGEMIQFQCSRCECPSTFAYAGGSLFGHNNYIYVSGPDIGNKLNASNFHQGQYVCNVCLANPGKQ